MAPKTAKKEEVAEITVGEIVKRFLKCYERCCNQERTSIPVKLKKQLQQCCSDDEYLKSFVFHPNAKSKPDDLPIKFNTFANAIRAERYKEIEDLHILNLPMPYPQVAALAILFEKGVYPIKFLEITNCLLEPASLRRVARTWSEYDLLSKVVLDFNEFGDAGCRCLREGMDGNTSITYLSLNFCDLGPESGQPLGELLAESAIMELHAEGNNLQVEGAIELIKPCAEMAARLMFEKNEELRKQREAEEAALQEAIERKKRRLAGEEDLPEVHVAKEPIAKPEEKKKKGGKKKKKKKEVGPPLFGPYIGKLFLADNGIDIHHENGLTASIMCMRVFRTLIAGSPQLVQLDIDDNLIGDVGAIEVLEGLRERTAGKLPKMKIRISHRMDPFILDEIWSLGGGGKKGKKGKGKKKK